MENRQASLLVIRSKLPSPQKGDSPGETNQVIDSECNENAHETEKQGDYVDNEIL